MSKKRRNRIVSKKYHCRRIASNIWPSLKSNRIPLHWSYISFNVLSKPNPVWFGKDTPLKCVRFSKPIPVWFGKKNWDFARRRFQTKFRLVWKNLMTIVNVMKIQNHIQFGLEKSYHSFQRHEKNKKISYFGKIQPEFNMNL